MSWREGFSEGVGNFLTARGLDVVRVIDFEDRTEYGGCCETCAYERAVVDVDYEDSSGNIKSYTYDGSFSELLREL